MIGTSGDEGGSIAFPHLHFGMMLKSNSNPPRPDLWMPNSRFYSEESDWRNGTMLDFISRPGWDTNYAYITAYTTDESGEDGYKAIAIQFGTWIVFDDYLRAPERETVKLWLDEFPALELVADVGIGKGLAILRLR